MIPTPRPIVSACLLAFLLLGGCGSDESSADGEASDSGIEVRGTWQSTTGPAETITEGAWDGITLVEYDNSQNYAITQNAPDVDPNPNGYNLVVWTEPDDKSFHYCPVVFGAPTIDEARAGLGIADSNDVDGTGCNGFPWTEMKAQ